MFILKGDHWDQQAKLLPSDGAAGDQFGWSVTLDGDTAVIGANRHDENGSDSGAAYVFARTSGVWTQQVKLLPADGATEDQFGYSVALEGDTAVIGAYRDDDIAEACGSAYVFTRADDVWTEQAEILPADGAPHDRFGSSVALDRDTTVIGAFLDDDNGENSGSAYVFRLLPGDGGDGGDGGVPASSGLGALLIVLVFLGSSAYFLRRRATD